MSSDANPKISVVIPVYNREDLIERAVASVRRQTYQPDEIIVADDGSTDGTAEVIKGLGVTYCHQENAGASEARNLGVRHATCDWIAFLDSDDYWFDDHLERMRDAVIATEGKARFYFSDLIRTEAEGNESHWSRCNMSIDEPYVLSDEGAEWIFLPRMPAMLQASLIDREAYLRMKGLWRPLKIRQDNHIFFKLSLDGPVCAVQGVSTQMTSDDDPENRVFGGAHKPGTKVYETESLLMYKDLIECTPNAPEKYRDEFRRRLKAAHFSMARIDREAGDYAEAARNALQGAVASPKHTAMSLLARVGIGDKANA